MNKQGGKCFQISLSIDFLRSHWNLLILNQCGFPVVCSVISYMGTYVFSTSYAPSHKARCWKCYMEEGRNCSYLSKYKNSLLEEAKLKQ